MGPCRVWSVCGEVRATCEVVGKGRGRLNACTSNHTRIQGPKRKEIKIKINQTHIRIIVRVFGGVETGQGEKRT